MRTIKCNEAQSIIDIACNKWKDILFNQWGKCIVLKTDIYISEEEYQGMRKVCTPPQHKVFDEIFGEDKPKFKIGDWVYSEKQFEDFRAEEFIPCFQIKGFNNNSNYARPIKDQSTGINIEYIRLATVEEIKAVTVFPDGTPCLVRDFGVWHLRYANGKGEFYIDGKKSGGTTSYWDHSMKLDMNNLPVNE